ncbi:MAG: hypothetical protein A3C90_02935 [Candidatus Magasanikbacteria bacterium RIFCSPHIGHO2_02_FULL_51_14]|uniref:Uncharacterized protein n=1 Tax=Candidatus Magasanikbacteria bacterium RIFCSPHIGHO2_02_FULL_51_14 TaxID=1798683 RepID=A0A1F6MQ00_9BACT|nr:MAG: hypothetical protein A3C90_02935 [Candidatus Magasanikbacteria bacterium RIFCSPHIGHO2_02_FULL_51_14]
MGRDEKVNNKKYRFKKTVRLISFFPPGHATHDVESRTSDASQTGSPFSSHADGTPVRHVEKRCIRERT